MKALQETPPKSFMESFLELTDWLANREQSLRTLTFVVNDVDVMDRQMAQLKVDTFQLYRDLALRTQG